MFEEEARKRQVSKLNNQSDSSSLPIGNNEGTTAGIAAEAVPMFAEEARKRMRADGIEAGKHHHGRDRWSSSGAHREERIGVRCQRRNEDSGPCRTLKTPGNEVPKVPA